MDARVGASATKTYSSNEWLPALKLSEHIQHWVVEKATNRPCRSKPCDHGFAEPCPSFQEKHSMTKFALFVRLEAKPGQEAAVAAFLASALPLANAELGTVAWFALQFGP